RRPLADAPQEVCSPGRHADALTTGPRAVPLILPHDGRSPPTFSVAGVRRVRAGILAFLVGVPALAGVGAAKPAKAGAPTPHAHNPFAPPVWAEGCYAGRDPPHGP